MVKQLVRIEPTVEPYTAPDGAKGWKMNFPDTNKYSLKRKLQFQDSTYTNPLSGHVTECWLIEGTQENIDRFVSENSTVVTLLTLAEAQILADLIRPSNVVTCDRCRGTGTLTTNAWTPPNMQ